MSGLADRIEEQGIQIGIAQGITQGKIEGIVQTTYDNIKKMIKNLGVTFDQAVKALEVDESKVEQYRKQYELETNNKI